jgi:hypothetical protein
MKSIVKFIANLFCCRSININVSLINQVTNMYIDYADKAVQLKKTIFNSFKI